MVVKAIIHLIIAPCYHLILLIIVSHAINQGFRRDLRGPSCTVILNRMGERVILSNVTDHVIGGAHYPELRAAHYGCHRLAPPAQVVIRSELTHIAHGVDVGALLLWQLALGLKGYDECRALAQLTLHAYRAAHELYQGFANAQAETCPPLVHLLVLFQSGKVHEELSQVFLGDPYPRVLDADLKVDVA